MEKQAYLPIKFYPVKEWQEYEKLKTYAGDKVIVKEYNNIPPAFQMVIGDIGRHWSADSFDVGLFQMVNYDTGATHNMDASLLIMYRGSGGFRTLVWRRIPTVGAIRDKGRYYYHLVEAEGDTEWFSEVFELCDLEINAFVEAGGLGFTGQSGFANFVSDYWDVNRQANIEFCKSSGAAPAYAYMPVDVFLEEELDLYVNTYDRSGTCGGIERDWDHPVFLYLRTVDGVVISEICRVDTTDTYYHFKLKAEVGGAVRIYIYINTADVTEGGMWISLLRNHTNKHIQLRWHNEKNFCKIVYEELPEITPFQYENICFIDAKQVIDENSINENVVEDDTANKYRIIGTAQKWNSLQLVGSECMLNAMSLLRLHSDVQIIKENGEPIDVVEMHIEQSVVDYHAALIKLVYREESCSEDNCGFQICCPTDYYPTMIGVFNGVGTLPAAANYNGQSAIVLIGVRNWQEYQSNGAVWNVVIARRVAESCLEIQNHYGGTFTLYSANGMQFSFFHTANTSTNWYPVIELTSVADATGGQATVTIYAEYWFGADVWCQVEYYTGTKWTIPLPFYIDQENWTPVIEKENLTAQTGARAMLVTCEVGTFWFRVRVRDGDCDMGYCIPLQQTIT